jgi:hypothetical protein
VFLSRKYEHTGIGSYDAHTSHVCNDAQAPSHVQRVPRLVGRQLHQQVARVVIRDMRHGQGVPAPSLRPHPRPRPALCLRAPATAPAGVGERNGPPELIDPARRAGMSRGPQAQSRSQAHAREREARAREEASKATHRGSTAASYRTGARHCAGFSSTTARHCPPGASDARGSSVPTRSGGGAVVSKPAGTKPAVSIARCGVSAASATRQPSASIARSPTGRARALPPPEEGAAGGTSMLQSVNSNDPGCSVVVLARSLRLFRKKSLRCTLSQACRRVADGGASRFGSWAARAQPSGPAGSAKPTVGPSARSGARAAGRA